MEDNSIYNELSTKIAKLGIVTKRVLAFIIDLLFLGFLSGLLGLITDKIDSLFFLSDYIFYIVIIMFLLRDIFFINGSLGKRIIKLKIVNYPDQSQVKWIKRIFRNVTTIIWPIEGVILLIAKKRIGDMIVKTDVITSNK